MGEYTTREFLVESSYSGQRLDKFLAGQIPEISRSDIQKLIKKGAVSVNHKICQKARYPVADNDKLTITWENHNSEIQAQGIDLDVIFEDEDILVINKPAGLTVHPGAGQKDHTLANALIASYGEVIKDVGEQGRPGIVHRLDKWTSGLMVVVKNSQSYRGLGKQIKNREVSRIYHAVIWGVPDLLAGQIDVPLIPPRGGKRRTVTGAEGREALTHYKVLKSIENTCCLCAFQLETGRTHQIRAHSAYIGHPVVGDNLYGIQETKAQSCLDKAPLSMAAQKAVFCFPRQALHAKELRFRHPRTDEYLHFESSYPSDIKQLLNKIF